MAGEGSIEKRGLRSLFNNIPLSNIIIWGTEAEPV
jgi:hypothetical protein